MFLNPAGEPRSTQSQPIDRETSPDVETATFALG